jgi:heme/copper-type cytochrome/quinol oxidase subunit 1
VLVGQTRPVVRRLVFGIGGLVGLAALLIGLGVLLGRRPSDFGWTSYAPLPQTVVLASGPDPLGLVLVVLGAALVGAGATGVALARRR